MYRIGFDVGGTFTDFTLLDAGSGTVSHLKLASTPGAPDKAVIEGLHALIDGLRVEPREIDFVGHGTTVATNMVIEGRGARTALLTTRGFRDVLEIGRQTRPHLYDYSVRKPEPLVARRHRFEVAERLDQTGAVLLPLDAGDVARAIDQILEQDIDSVAICYLHSYANPAHEIQTRDLIKARAPKLYISLSSEILPEFREFERFSTTVLNAYIGPRMARYLDGFVSEIRQQGIAAPPYTIHSNGGVMSVATARERPVRTCLSGPAAGVVGAAEVARLAGFSDVVTFDAGGTSTDVSLIRAGKPLFTSDRMIAGYPIKSPMIDIHVVGAGGGSIAAVDDAGALKVGPESAGAQPGPACYGKGGTRPTLTDANLLLGRLSPGGLVGGRVPLDRDRAARALERFVALPLGLDLAAAADGIIRIAVSNMSRAIRSVSTERGYDLAGFTLIAFGGAGPLHAAAVAAALGMAKVIVPREPGTMCARGILMSDVSLDFVATLMTVVDHRSWPGIENRFARMRRDGEDWLDGEHVAKPERGFEAVADARYQGQNHEVRVDMGGLEGGLEMFFERFHAAHTLAHGYALPDRPVEIVNCRLKALGHVPRPGAEDIADHVGDLDALGALPREVYFGAGPGWLRTPVFDRGRLGAGLEIPGPAVIEEMSATTLVMPGQRAGLDRQGNIIIEVGGEPSV